MGSLRFPSFSFPQPQRSNHSPLPPWAAAAAVGVGSVLALSLKSTNLPIPPSVASPFWASLSLADGAAGSPVEARTGVSFPAVLDGTRRLLGIGLRKKSVFGLKNIDIYAFGVYADDSDVKKLSDKYGTLPLPDIKKNKELMTDVLDQDLRMTVRLQIVYGRLSIRSVRSAFEDSVGTRLQKINGQDSQELLQRFTSLFKDEYKLPRGSIIDLSREKGYILKTRIDGKEVGSIQSKLLCQAVLDLYIGEDPFDRNAKDDVERNLASLIQTLD